jgi:homoserine acetyltransferase
MSILSTRILLILIIVAGAGSLAFSQTTQERPRNYPAPVEGDYTIKDFKFRSGEILPELKLHYLTIGTPAKDNAVLIMHGTGGTGAQFLSAQFANILFGPGQLLDATKYFIILPDAIGHGGSSKPSNGLHMKFPHYTYYDMCSRSIDSSPRSWASITCVS